jgi:uncharacterized membrane protein YedE/YeeE
MKSYLAAFGGGSLFAIGLAVSGMTQPSKVTGFLDVAGAWDASLGFVMAAALAVSFIAYRIIRRRTSPLFDVKFHLPTRRDIDWRLVVGAGLFGIGWGLGGFCPGPGLVAAAGGGMGAVAFVVGMTAGMLIEHATARAIARRSSEARPARASGSVGWTRRTRRLEAGNAQGQAELPLDKNLGEQP